MRKFRIYLRYFRRNPEIIEIRGVWKRGVALEREKQVKRKRDDLRRALSFPIVVPMIFAGLFMAGIFYPLAFLYAPRPISQKIEVILFQAPAQNLSEYFFCAMALYGFLYVSAGIVMIISSLLALLINLQGIIFGLITTMIISHLLFGGFQDNYFEKHTFTFKLFYLLSFYYSFNILTALLSRDDLSKHKNEFFFMGLYGLFSGWLLEKDFGSNAVVFSGVLFLSVSYFSMWIWEFFCRNFSIFLQGAFGVERFKMFFDEQHFYTMRELFELFRHSIRSDSAFFWKAVLFIFLFPFLLLILYLHFVPKIH